MEDVLNCLTAHLVVVETDVGIAVQQFLLQHVLQIIVLLRDEELEQGKHHPHQHLLPLLLYHQLLLLLLANLLGRTLTSEVH